MSGLESDIRKQRGLIVGRSGYGKTNVAKGSLAEPLLRDGARVGIFDPTDSWHGLRLKADGETPAFKVVIFGGEFGDLPLYGGAGEVMGRTLAHAPDSWIISFADMVGESHRQKFAAEFLEALYEHNRAPITLIIDEADTFAPQKPNDPIQNTLTARMTQIVKRGRKRGFTPWLITQRPADIAKSVTSQADVVIAMSLTLPHDKKAIMDYVKDHDEDGTATTMFKAMPQLPRGEGILWFPGGGILERRSFPLSKTFDSGKTPEPGDRQIKLQPLKVDTLAAAMAAFVEEKKANDPAALKKRIRELEAEVARKQPAPVVDETAVKAAFDRGLAKGAEDQRISDQRSVKAWLAEIHPPELPAPVHQFQRVDIPHIARGGSPAPPALQATRSAPLPPRQPSGPTGEGLIRGERVILTVLAQYAPATLDKARLGAISGFASKGGSFRTYIGRLKTLGFIDRDALRITTAGLEALGDFTPLPTGPALLNHWCSRLVKGEREILQAVAAHGGEATRDQIGSATSFEPSGGSFRTYVGKLKTLGLLTGSNPLLLHEDLR